MSVFQSGAASSGRYVFVPEMPTPNGRLHLGHMSGPYLRADILARFLRSRGAEAYVISGSDVYESHVDLKASQTQKTIPDVCNEFHRLIRAELDALGVQVELYVNPLDPEIGPAYLATNRRILDELRACGAAVRAPEKVLYSAARDRFVAGCWMSGKCPSCGVKSGSYLCEECGTQYDPQDVKDVVVPSDASDAREVTVESWFLSIRRRDELWKQIAKMGIAPDFVRIVERYFEERGPRVRLTNPGRWGMTYEAADQVIFTYTALFSFSVFCGELLAQRRGWTANPFDAGSGCTTIAGFGIDNAIPYLVGVLGSAIELGTIRPFDYYLTNHFYQLEGKKFSTSRKHLVCARELTEAGVHADALRYYLAKVNPELGKRSFSAADFARCHNQYLQEEIGSRLDAALRRAAAAPPGDLPADLGERLEELYRAQKIDLDFPRPNLERAIATVDTWALVGANPGTEADANRAYWWVKGFALLAGPFMPSLANELWRRLGHDGEPRPAAFLDPKRAVSHEAPWRPFSPISLERLEQCISYETQVR